MRHTETSHSDAANLLAWLAATDRPPIRERIAVVVAHPDDESLGCGALLPRLSDLLLIHVTDGAPRTGNDSRRAGFPSPDAYAAARRRELDEALAAGGVSPARRISFDVPDQDAALALAAVARRLAPLLAGAALVLTHAPEGGHPDHDATAAATGAALLLLAEHGDATPPVATMPFYRAGPDGTWLRQIFADPTGTVVLQLTQAERTAKAAMLDAHRTQAGTLRAFGAADEAFRLAQSRDLLRPPPGPALYDGFGWPVTSAILRERIDAALAELGLRACA